MKLVLVGLNHKTAPVELRERLAFDERRLPEAFRSLKNLGGIEECFILSTCNRVEVTVVSPDSDSPTTALVDFLAGHGQLDPPSLLPHLYCLEDRQAIHHLFRVASSLDSMVVGEPQILGQMKTALALAKSYGAAGGFLEAILTRAFNVAKRVRTETEIGRSAVSVSYAAVELAREIFGSLAGRKVLLVGAGKMSELAARHLHSSGADQIFVTNRSQDRAVQLAQCFNGAVVEYNQFTRKLPEIDILIASSGAPHYILSKEDVRRALEARRNRPIFLIDIAVPRNIDPAVNELEGAFLYDIDDLQQVADRNRQKRLRQAELAEHIVAQEVDRMMFRLSVRDVAPTIAQLQEKLEQIRKAELDRFRGKLSSLSPDQQQLVEAITRSIIGKIAHPPIAELRRSATQPDSFPTVDLIRKIFRLDDE